MMGAALYQQRPAPEEGDYFRVDWLKPYEKHPPKDQLRTYGASDYAVTADGGDYTVHCVVGLDPENRMYLLDLWRKQATSDVWIEAFWGMVLRWKPQGWAEEQGQIRSGVGPFRDKRQLLAVVFDFPFSGDKRGKKKGSPIWEVAFWGSLGTPPEYAETDHQGLTPGRISGAVLALAAT